MNSIKYKIFFLILFTIVAVFLILNYRNVNGNVTMKGIIKDAYLSNYPYGFFSQNRSWPLDVVSIPSHYIDTEITINAVIVYKDSTAVLTNVVINSEKVISVEEWHYTHSSGSDPFDSLGE